MSGCAMPAIRQAMAGDAGSIAEIWAPVVRDTTITFTDAVKSPDEVAALIAERGSAGWPFLLSETPGAVLGFATYAPFRAGPGYARTMEHSVILAPQARGHGLGRALMAALLHHARAGGVHSLWAGVSGENPAGIGFHAALGFRHVATLPEVGFKFGRFIDLVLMMRHP